MKFRSTRLKISQNISDFASKEIKRQKIPVPRVTKKILIELASVAQAIEGNGLPKNLVIKKLKGNLGSGIFLRPDADPIPKGAVIAPYSGEVLVAPQNYGNDSDYVFAILTDLLLTKEEQKFYDPKNRYHPRRLYSLDLDAEKLGNFTRFINHSSQPNIEAHFLKIPPNDLGVEPSPFEIIYMTNKVIRPGEQLLVCYEGEDKSYWGAIKVKPFPMTPKTFRLNSSLEIVP